MHERIATALLKQVFFEVSAIVSLDGDGRILGVFLFSTDWPENNMRIAEGAREVWLISNHPQGEQAPYPQDLRNCSTIAGMSKGISVRFFLCSEYFSCFEAEIP